MALPIRQMIHAFSSCRLHASSSCLQSSIPSSQSSKYISKTYPDRDKVSRFDQTPEVQGWAGNHNAEVRINERFSRTPCTLHRALFFALVLVEPLNRPSTGIRYFFINEGHGVRWARVCAGVGELATRIWINSSWPGAPSFMVSKKRWRVGHLQPRSYSE